MQLLVNIARNGMVFLVSILYSFQFNVCKIALGFYFFATAILTLRFDSAMGNETTIANK